MSSPIDLVLSRAAGYGLRETGKGRWRMLGACHGGNNRSAVSIGEGDGGVVMIKCFHGCPVESVVAALGLEVTDLFPPRLPAGGGAPAAARRRLLTAGQALDLLDSEATLLIVCAADLARGEALDEATRDRLRLGAARIALMRQEVHA